MPKRLAYSTTSGMPISRASLIVIRLIECSTPKRNVCVPPDLPSKFAGVHNWPLPSSIVIGASGTVEDGV